LPHPLSVESLAPGDARPAARVLGDAFLDDPVWSAIGPRRRRHRRLANRLAFAGIVAATRRHDVRLRVARSAGGDVVGVTVAFAPGKWPLPDGAVVFELGWLAVAGPLPAMRGLRDDREMRAHHVRHPHVYLWFLAVDPGYHGNGVGRALLADLHADSDAIGAPTFLETATPENVAFYERDGYEVLGEIAMPSGAKMWRMERPTPVDVAPGAA
jgi:ribosomal protein S18 acetylase RimI-like enzyme